MKQKKMLSLTLSELKIMYKQRLPDIVSMAESSCDENEFKQKLNEYVGLHNEWNARRSEHIRMLIEYDGKNINELSTGEDMHIQTLTLLWNYLKNPLDKTEASTDLFIDLFFLFYENDWADSKSTSTSKIKRQMGRWSTGIDKETVAIRVQNKERMIRILSKKIEQKKRFIHVTPLKKIYLKKASLKK